MTEWHFCLVLFELKIARHYSLKRQATSALQKKQNPISPNDRIGFKWHWGGNTQKMHIRGTSTSQQDFLAFLIHLHTFAKNLLKQSNF